MDLPPPPPPPPWREDGERPGTEQVPGTHNIGGDFCRVYRRWPQHFAKGFPDLGPDNKPIMKAVHMPYARWMYVKGSWGSWGVWQVDLGM